MDKKAIKTHCLLLALVMICTFAAGCSKKSEEPEQDTETAYTIDNIRDYVIGVDEPVELGDGTMQPLINFDNAATTPALKPVMVQSLSFSKQIIE